MDDRCPFGYFFGFVSCLLLSMFLHLIHETMLAGKVYNASQIVML